MKKDKDKLDLATPEEIGIRLMDYKVLIQLDNPAEMIGGIYIPPSAREDTTQGHFIAASPAAWDYLGNVDMDIPVWGERVFCAKYSGRNIVGKNKKCYRMMNDKDIYAILDYKND
jgi:co-chaperonin GroES (HSP10)